MGIGSVPKNGDHGLQGVLFPARLLGVAELADAGRVPRSGWAEGVVSPRRGPFHRDDPFYLDMDTRLDLTAA